MSTVARSAPPPDCEEAAPPRVARLSGRWYAVAWTPVLLLVPVVAAAQRFDVLQLLAVLLLGAVHVTTAIIGRRAGARRLAEALVAVSVLMVIAYQLLWDEHQVFLYPLLALTMAVGVRRRLAPGLISGIALSGAVAAGLTSARLADALVFAIITYMAGFSAVLIDSLSQSTVELAAARERLARSAVAEERARFSRDLHDLLGHTLSVIVVKAQAVRRFAATDPGLTAEHARGIEEIGRNALEEVREAVAGYREEVLADELDSARSTLSDAGVRTEIRGTGTVLPPQIDRLFAWTVREGVTNILRHAPARSCAILVELANGVATIEIIDDGRPGGPAAEGAAAPTGSGLAGLRERAERLGGVLAADHEAGGFRLGVSVPVTETRSGP
ncbi:sensor histidine kinase [Brachybacterium vulturis]|uniref:Sensor histidine kinase n=1 Tax=Brachybacterium vulturis TaxID=2017484 RepID=A0A291GLK9_9MICO|nr:histidine kinase [Brachybacterium vulturis]ATG51383.1 sensor histidine kinase [Brachybacterium vulturis]